MPPLTFTLTPRIKLSNLVHMTGHSYNHRLLEYLFTVQVIIYSHTSFVYFISILLSPSLSLTPVLHTRLPLVPLPLLSSLSSYTPVTALIDLTRCSTASGKAPGYICVRLRLDLSHVFGSFVWVYLLTRARLASNISLTLKKARVSPCAQFSFLNPKALIDGLYLKSSSVSYS